MPTTITTTQEAVRSWKWRIHKAGLRIGEFCNQIDMQPQQLSRYMSGKICPTLDTFDRIEGKLKDLGV